MGFNYKASAGGGDYEQPPAGNHPAVLVALIDMGTQRNDYQGKVRWDRKVLLAWELTTKKQANGKNFVVVRDYTCEKLTSKSKLRILLEGWRGRQYRDDEEVNLEAILGKPCLLGLVAGKSSTGKDITKLESASQIPDGMTKPVPTCPLFTWEVGGDVALIPNWIPFLYGEDVKEVIARCNEISGGAPAKTLTNGQQQAEAKAADEVPF